MRFVRFVSQVFVRFFLVLALISTDLGEVAASTTTFTTAGAYTYTVPAGVTRLQVRLAGAGGGGGGYDNAAAGAGGPGALVTLVLNVTPGQIISGTVGAGGATGWTSGTAFGNPCNGGGTGGAGYSAGGRGGFANCPNASGYSGGGGGGGGSSSLLLGGVNVGQAAGGGGGGYAAGAAGSAAVDGGSPTGGFGGQSCGSTNAAVVSSFVTAGGGGAGGAARTSTGTTSTGSGAGGSVTIATQTTLQLTMISNGGVSSFPFSGTNVWLTQTISTVTPGTGVTGARQAFATPSIATTITEAIPAGYAMTSATCAGVGSGGTATVNTTAGTITFNGAALAYGNDISCTVVNTAIPVVATLTIQKSKSTTGPVTVGQTIVYTYVVANTGNVAINNVKVDDLHGSPAVLIATGPAGIANETLTVAGPLGTAASPDVTPNNGIWSTLAPGASVSFQYTHTVTQAEFDNG
jgi:hypothetical protein